MGECGCSDVNVFPLPENNRIAWHVAHGSHKPTELASGAEKSCSLAQPHPLLQAADQIKHGVRHRGKSTGFTTKDVWL